MAKELSNEEKISLNDLEQNFQQHIDNYREKMEAEVMKGAEIDLKRELLQLQAYLEGCHRSEIDDLRVNIDFCAAKVEILKELLGVEE